MKNYKYIARDSSGQRKEGLKEAASSNDLLGWLREQELTPVSVNEIAVAQKKPAEQFTERESKQRTWHHFVGS